MGTPGARPLLTAHSCHLRRRPMLQCCFRIVPFTAFSEPNFNPGKNKEAVWFALDEDQPLGFFARVWTEWTSVRKVKDGETTDNLFGFGFLTCDANKTVGAIHPKAMPVVLTEPSDIETCLNAPTEDALKFQRPLQDGLLQIVEHKSNPLI